MVAIPPGDYGGQHILLNFHGQLPGGEVWSIGLRTGGANPSAEELAIYAKYAAEIFSNAWRLGADAILGINPIGVTFAGVTARLIQVSGVTQFVAEATPAIACQGLQAVQGAPNQSAVVISLRTPLAGKHGRGRVYLPVLNPDFNAQGRLTPQYVGSIAGFMKKVLDGLNTIKPEGHGADDPPSRLWTMSVQSRTSGQPGPPITSIQVGDVADTIRGRRNRLPETYSSRPVVAPTI